MEEERCRICGEIKRLTFEHIPPKASGNNKPAKIVTGEQVITSDRNPWDINGLRYTLQQRGMGKPVLCECCNNITGSWYADAFKSFYFQIPFVRVDPVDPKCSLIELTFSEIYPLRVMKQITSMFMGICGAHLGDEYPEMREFVLSRKAKQLDFSKYRFSFFVRKGDFRNPQQLAQFVSLRQTSNGYQHNRVSYIDTPTVEFLFEEQVNGKLTDDLLGIDLRQFANDFNYNDCATLKVLMPTFERNSWIPYDVRTQKEITIEAEKNRKWAEDNQF